MKLEYRESENVEFKREVCDSLIKTIIAFANGSGGRILIGVENDGEVVGIEDVDVELLRLTDKMRANIRPDGLMMVATNVMRYDGADVIEVAVQTGPKRPYYLASKGLRAEGVYVRSGAASVPSSHTAILQMIREAENESFESNLSLQQDLTFNFVASYLAQRGVELNEGAMHTLGLRNGELYTNLALLLSDQCPTFIKAAVFADDERNVFQEREEFSGSILSQLEQAYSFMTAHNHFMSRFEGLQRIDFYDYPDTALREALMNAVAHREYALSGPTLVNIMPSGISIVSLGGLVSGITFEDLNANISMPRNKLLASLLYRIGSIEAWGTGIGRMRSAYSDDAEAVDIMVTSNTFSVLLANRNAAEEEIAETSDDEMAIIDVVAHGCRTRVEIEERVGFSQSKTINLLSELVKRGALIKQGNSRNTTYRIP